MEGGSGGESRILHTSPASLEPIIQSFSKAVNLYGGAILGRSHKKLLLNSHHAVETENTENICLSRIIMINAPGVVVSVSQCVRWWDMHNNGLLHTLTQMKRTFTVQTTMSVFSPEDLLKCFETNTECIKLHLPLVQCRKRERKAFLCYYATLQTDQINMENVF